MAVTVQSSQAASDPVQKDGRAWVYETIVLSNGVSLRRWYFADAGADQAAHLADWVSNTLTDLAQAEISANIAAATALGLMATPTFVYSTVAQNAAALRDAYAQSSRVEAIMIGDYLNTLTNTQIANAFGITTGQAATLRANKLVPAAALAASIRAEVGQ
jgi:hypothetical protein